MNPRYRISGRSALRRNWIELVRDAEDIKTGVIRKQKLWRENLVLGLLILAVAVGWLMAVE